MFASFYSSVGSILAPMLPTNELFLAIQNKDPNMARMMANTSDFDLNRTDMNGYAAIHVVCKHCNYDAFNMLVNQRGVSLVLPDTSGNTPFHWAAKYGHLDLCKYFIERGMSPLIRNNKGETPYDVAENYHVIKQYLLPLQFKYENNEVITAPVAPPLLTAHAAYGIQNRTSNSYIPPNQPMNYDESSSNMTISSNSTDSFSDQSTMFVDPKLLNSYRISPIDSSNNVVTAHPPPPPPPQSSAVATTGSENIVQASTNPVVKKVVTPSVSVPSSKTIKKAEIVKNLVFNSDVASPLVATANTKPPREDRMQGAVSIDNKGPLHSAAGGGGGACNAVPFIPTVPTHNNSAPSVVPVRTGASFIPTTIITHTIGPANKGATFIPAASTHDNTVPPKLPVNTGAPFIHTGAPPLHVGTNMMIPKVAVMANPPVVPAVVTAPKIVTKTIVPANDGFHSSTTDPQLQAKYGHNIEVKRTAPPPTTSAFTPAQYSAYSNDTSPRSRYVVYDPNSETCTKNNGYQQQQPSNYFPQTSFFASQTLPTAAPSGNYVYQAPPLPHNMNASAVLVQHHAPPPVYQQYIPPMGPPAHQQSVQVFNPVTDDVISADSNSSSIM